MVSLDCALWIHLFVTPTRSELTCGHDLVTHFPTVEVTPFCRSAASQLPPPSSQFPKSGEPGLVAQRRECLETPGKAKGFVP